MVKAFELSVPKTLPRGWNRLENVFMQSLGAPGPNYCPAFMRKDGLRVIMTGSVEQDGAKWIHLSMSFRDRIPSYFDMKDVKRIFLGEEALALQIFAPSGEHVNIHSNTLHLWQCLDRRPVPDFTWGLGTI